MDEVESTFFIKMVQNCTVTQNLHQYLTFCSVDVHFFTYAVRLRGGIYTIAEYIPVTGFLPRYILLLLLLLLLLL
jgi:hypothetical protein